MKKLYFAVLLSMAIFVCNAEQTIIRGKVFKVIDGDTFWMKTEKEENVKIRLYGIDCPELSQLYGLEAKECIEKALLNKHVGVIKKGTSFDRVVGIVWHKNGLVNSILIAYGLAWVDLRYLKDAQFRKSWIELERLAKENKINIWSQENPTAPWDYRKIKRGK